MNGINGDAARRQTGFSLRNIPAPEQVIDLAKGKLWTINSAQPGQTVSCLEGEIWLTQEDDHEDYFLAAGEAMMITNPGRVTIQALKDSAVAKAAKPAVRHSAQHSTVRIH